MYARTESKPHKLCQTRAQKITFLHEWAISDFTALFKENVRIESLPFQIPDYPMTGIMGITNRKTEEHRQSCDKIIVAEMHMNLKSDLIPLLLISIEVSILNCNGVRTPYGSRDISEVEENNDITMALRFHSSKLKEGELINNDTMRIFCLITIINSISTSPHHRVQVPLPEHSLISNFKTLFNNQKHSDVTITVGDEKFHAHKAILSARSSVFAAMFEHKMKEDENHNVDITDLSEEVMEELLQFIYTDQAYKLNDMAIELLDAAEKYDLKNLKILCASHLQDNLNFENAAEILIIADRYNLKEVKDDILIFIGINKKRVMQTPGYERMTEQCPELQCEVTETLLRKLML